jgi:tungstate transport system ATP-binding protein
MVATPSASNPLYILEGVRKAYGGRTVLDVEHLEVRCGEVLAVVGPSGSGKSTLLRLLNFLEPPSGGRILFEGQPISLPVPLATLRRVTMVFQRPQLLNRSVEANVAYGLKLRGRPRDGRVQQVLARVGLASLAGAPARSLSGGEAQRVALARALVLEPQALLLDEPTANLDPYNVGLIEDLIRAQNAEQGTTIVLVTHNVFQARRLAHRCALLLEGRLIEVAPTEAFFEESADPRTAAFVRGEMVY